MFPKSDSALKTKNGRGHSEDPRAPPPHHRPALALSQAGPGQAGAGPACRDLSQPSGYTLARVAPSATSATTRSVWWSEERDLLNVAPSQPTNNVPQVSLQESGEDCAQKVVSAHPAGSLLTPGLLFFKKMEKKLNLDS